MKVHIQNKLIKTVAVCLCAALLSTSVVNTFTIPVYAATSTDIALTKVLDMALTKTGISANSSLLQKLQASILNMLNGTASSYTSYCQANNLDKNSDSWSQYLTSDAYISGEFLIPNWLLNCAYFVNWITGTGLTSTDVMESDVVQMLCGDAVAVQGEEYLISDEAVEYIRDEFELIAKDEAGYIYINTLSPDTINPLWFSDKASYEWFKAFIAQSQYTHIVSFAGSSAGQLFTTGSDNEFVATSTSIQRILTDFYIVDNLSSQSGYVYSYRLYSPDWNTLSVRGTSQPISTFMNSFTDDSTFEEYLNTSNISNTGVSVLNCNIGISAQYSFDYQAGLVTNDGHPVRVFNTIEDMKLFSVGVQPYYINSETTYNLENDNSLKFTGDYIKDNSNTYSYDIIQNEIDNSTEVNESTVNNIVNNNTSTIVNNYYTTTGSDDGDGDDTGNGGGISGDSINSLINGITGLLDFVINLLGNVISLIATFLNSALELLSGLSGQFGGFTQLLGDMFAFIPPELIDAISAGITLLIGVAIVKALKG